MRLDDVRYCGRVFTVSQMETIRTLIADIPRANRAQLSRRVCQILDWRRPDGRLKEMSCRVVMLCMHRDGLITLPPPQKGNGNGRPYGRRTLQAQPELVPVTDSAGTLQDLSLIHI